MGKALSTSCHCSNSLDYDSSWHCGDALLLGYPRKLPQNLAESAQLVFDLYADESVDWRCLHVTDKGAISKVQVSGKRVGSSFSCGTSASDGSELTVTFRIALFGLPSSVTTLFVIGTVGKWESFRGRCQASLHAENPQGATSPLGVFRKSGLYDGNILKLLVVYYRHKLWWIQGVGKTYHVKENGDVDTHPRGRELPPIYKKSLERMVPTWLSSLEDPGMHEHEVPLGGGGSCLKEGLFPCQRQEIVIYQRAGMEFKNRDWYVNSDDEDDTLSPPHPAPCPPDLTSPDGK